MRRSLLLFSLLIPVLAYAQTKPHNMTDADEYARAAGPAFGVKQNFASANTEEEIRATGGGSAGAACFPFDSLVTIHADTADAVCCWSFAANDVTMGDHDSETAFATTYGGRTSQGPCTSIPAGDTRDSVPMFRNLQRTAGSTLAAGLCSARVSVANGAGFALAACGDHDGLCDGLAGGWGLGTCDTTPTASELQDFAARGCGFLHCMMDAAGYIDVRIER